MTTATGVEYDGNNTGATNAYQPHVLRISAGYVWAIDAANNDVYYYEDTLKGAGPDLVAPADGFLDPMNVVSGQAYDMTFRWDRISKATKYELYVATDADFDEKVVQEKDIASTSSTVVVVIGPNTAIPAGTSTFTWLPARTYYWKVRTADDGPIYSPYSEVRSFTIEPTLGVVPTINAPADGAAGVSLTPAFAWSSVDGATSYTFQIALDAGFTIPGWTTKSLTNNAYLAEHELEYGTTYFWKVTPYDGKTPMGDAAVGVFTTMEETVVVDQYACPQCGLVFMTQEELAEHWAKYHAPVPPTPTAPAIPTYLLWTIVGIGAVLFIALIVLIVRTRRVA
jgi:hypothetical protein